MTEEELAEAAAGWLSCTAPGLMLRYVRQAGGAARTEGGRRGLRLFGCACCRRVWDLLADEGIREAVEVAEQYAEGLADPEAMHEAGEGAWVAGGVALRGAAYAVTRGQPELAADAWRVTSTARGGWGSVECGRERTAQCGLIRCIFGNPFRPLPALEPAWLAWNEGTVQRVAKQVYRERAFDQLPVLADALEDAGCRDEGVLGHLRGGGPHALGCWVLDWVLDKG